MQISKLFEYSFVNAMTTILTAQYFKYFNTGILFNKSRKGMNLAQPGFSL